MPALPRGAAGPGPGRVGGSPRRRQSRPTPPAGVRLVAALVATTRLRFTSWCRTPTQGSVCHPGSSAPEGCPQPMPRPAAADGHKGWCGWVGGGRLGAAAGGAGAGGRAAQALRRSWEPGLPSPPPPKKKTKTHHRLRSHTTWALRLACSPSRWAGPRVPCHTARALCRGGGGEGGALLAALAAAGLTRPAPRTDGQPTGSGPQRR